MKIEILKLQQEREKLCKNINVEKEKELHDIESLFFSSALNSSKYNNEAFDIKKIDLDKSIKEIKDKIEENKELDNSNDFFVAMNKRIKNLEKIKESIKNFKK